MGALPALVYFLYLVCFISICIICYAIACLLLGDTKRFIRVAFALILSAALYKLFVRSNFFIDKALWSILIMLSLAGLSIGLILHLKARSKIENIQQVPKLKLSRVQIFSYYVVGLVLTFILFCVIYFGSFYLFAGD